jgi:hypothetical protein
MATLTPRVSVLWAAEMGTGYFDQDAHGGDVEASALDGRTPLDRTIDRIGMGAREHNRMILAQLMVQCRVLPMGAALAVWFRYVTARVLTCFKSVYYLITRLDGRQREFISPPMSKLRTTCRCGSKPSPLLSAACSATSQVG